VFQNFHANILLLCLILSFVFNFIFRFFFNFNETDEWLDGWMDMVAVICRMQDAEACFMIAARNYTDKTAAVSQ